MNARIVLAHLAEAGDLAKRLRTDKLQRGTARARDTEVEQEWMDHGLVELGAQVERLTRQLRDRFV